MSNGTTQRYFAWAKDPFGAIKSISSDTQAEAEKAAAEKGWTIIAGQYGSFPTKPEEKLTLPEGMTKETMPATEYLRYIPETKEYAYDLTKYDKEAASVLEPQRFSLETYQWKPISETKTIEQLLSEQLAKTQAEKEEAERQLKELNKKLTGLNNEYQYKLKRTIETPWLTAEASQEEKEKLDQEYITKLETEIEDYINKYPEKLDDVIKQLNKMGEVGFPIGDIEKRVKGIVTSYLLPKVGTMKELAERYVRPKIESEYAPIIKQLTGMTTSQIENLLKVPKEWKEYYLGTEEKMGYLQQLKKQTEEQKKKIEEKINTEISNLKDFMDTSLQKLQNDMNYQLTLLEEKRQIGKNYLTGQLAKLGALNTTGAAMNSIANLEAKYDQMITKTRSDYNFAIAEQKYKYQQLINNLEEKKDEAILKLQSDYTKTEREINEKIMDITFKTQEKIDNLLSKYVDKVYDIQRDMLKLTLDQTEKYFKDFYNTVSTTLQTDILERVLPSLINYKAIETQIKREKDMLDIIKARQLIAEGAMGVSTQDIETYAQDVLTGKITLSSVPNEIQPRVSRRIEEIKRTPSPEWLRERGYQTDVSYLPTSPVVKEWQEELKKLAEKQKTLTEAEWRRKLQQDMFEVMNIYKDEKGFVSPEIFNKARESWIAKGGKIEDFNKTFSIYVNPKKKKQYGYQ